MFEYQLYDTYGFPCVFARSPVILSYLGVLLSLFSSILQGPENPTSNASSLCFSLFSFLVWVLPGCTDFA
ncbi:uncharacterized protein BDW43DRAFT_290749 [Aspergillus alliaceus]|uniref:uncharacterized protein n=1 Tax=Petromyces alliaceus TaxID=209559 RepID=UPI0012A61250|nr:uncharacterized protein BDW43DRAFT_290749 [Aspergillus alliaceus]KAB8228552.1 hypothetical protein BDW43DRAFT_290749 [Aspergillus alliaceus]